MSDPNSDKLNLLLIVVGLGVCAAIAAVAFLGDSDDPAPESNTDAEASRDDQSGQPPEDVPQDDTIDELVRAADKAANAPVDRDSEDKATAPSGNKRVIQLQGGATVEVPADSPAAKAMEAREAANRLEAEAMNNPGPMGADNWSAPISAKEEAQIQAAFDALPEPDPRVSRADRKTSIEVARAVVEGCFRDLLVRQPGRRGRIAVAWVAMASGGEGLIQDPEITLNLRLDEDIFERCIVTGLDGLTFPSSEPGEPLRVEYPFFFDQ